MWKQQPTVARTTVTQQYDTQPGFMADDPESPHHFSPQEAIDLYEDAARAITRVLPLLEKGAMIYVDRLPFFTRLKWRLLKWQPDSLRKALECRSEFQRMASEVRTILQRGHPKLERVSMNDGVYEGARSWIDWDPEGKSERYR